MRSDIPIRCVCSIGIHSVKCSSSSSSKNKNVRHGFFFFSLGVYSFRFLTSGRFCPFLHSAYTERVFWRISSLLFDLDTHWPLWNGFLLLLEIIYKASVSFLILLSTFFRWVIERQENDREQDDVDIGWALYNTHTGAWYSPPI